MEWIDLSHSSAAHPTPDKWVSPNTRRLRRAVHEATRGSSEPNVVTVAGVCGSEREPGGELNFGCSAPRTPAGDNAIFSLAHYNERGSKRSPPYASLRVLRSDCQIECRATLIAPNLDALSSVLLHPSDFSK
ncbi:hypothetical protein LshimejAT787_0805750 [Lyophyllum shimeji]|uniref:Uncharacterized protein n=1 Tax=Lyophyllum shimeji TaxID=47721 RepID=A0A9P3UMQ4_LYOSH|nr:hypothetical protein LshimejAT787_0805750 [Lyophyllum shimeji]